MKKLILMTCVLLAAAMGIHAQEIFDAVRSGDLSKVKELVEKDPQLINARNAKQLTPLDVSLVYQKREVAEYLLEKGAVLPEIGTDRGIQLLRNSLKSGSLIFLGKYVQMGFDPRYEIEGKSNLLHYASASHSIELIDKLIRLGVSVNKANIYGLTPLHIAAMRGNLEVSKFLVRNGAEINLRNNEGKTPYHLALESQKMETVNYLATLGADTSMPKYPELAGEYFGEPKPGRTAVPFSRGMSWPQYMAHSSIVVAPDGNEMLWNIQLKKMYSSKRIDGRWTKPEIIMDADVPFISPDGKKLYVIVLKKNEGRGKEIICVSEKTDRGWSELRELPEIINAVRNIHWGISVDRKGNLYFGAEYGIVNGAMYAKIYCSEYVNGEYRKPQIVKGLEYFPAYSPYISPDGSYLIITKSVTSTSFILFRKKDRSWTEPIELAAYIGSKGRGECSTVTHDGRYLFFLGTIDGRSGIPYWVDASFIEDLRKEALKDDK